MLLFYHKIHRNSTAHPILHAPIEIGNPLQNPLGGIRQNKDAEAPCEHGCGFSERDLAEQQTAAGDEENQRRQLIGTLLLVLYRRTECETQCRRNQQNGNHFDQIGKGIGIFQRMCGVDAHIAAAVGADLFDCDLAGRRTHRYELLGDDLCIRNDFAIYSDGFGV